MACQCSGERLAVGAFILAGCCSIIVGILHWVLCEDSCSCSEEHCCSREDYFCSGKEQCYCMEQKDQELDGFCEEASHECPAIVTFSLIPLIVSVVIFMTTVVFSFIKSCCLRDSNQSVKIPTNEMSS